MNTFLIHMFGWILLVFSIFLYIVTQSQLVTVLIALTGLFSVSYGLLYQSSPDK
ncbi:hypothetical protein [Priestia filamentosa]|uniref:hypothetical protein n=1 Tax=Priestia filamentosa TaxID=1402861 RepID=UPI000372AAF3|nr:hypothetical protein [Priestia filamentosa]MDT3766109.1 hypothetical protein [Priestia filamentosa]WRU97927.1 hypothetical protein RYX51_22985 [Priestia filamentosa]SMF71063.1 hypothetical protein SAMN06296056_11244 [Priestia filamentosa]